MVDITSYGGDSDAQVHVEGTTGATQDWANSVPTYDDMLDVFGGEDQVEQESSLNEPDWKRISDGDEEEEGATEVTDVDDAEDDSDADESEDDANVEDEDEESPSDSDVTEILAEVDEPVSTDPLYDKVFDGLPKTDEEYNKFIALPITDVENQYLYEALSGTEYYDLMKAASGTDEYLAYLSSKNSVVHNLLETAASTGEFPKQLNDLINGAEVGRRRLQDEAVKIASDTLVGMRKRILDNMLNERKALYSDLNAWHKAADSRKEEAEALNDLSDTLIAVAKAKNPKLDTGKVEDTLQRFCIDLSKNLGLPFSDFIAAVGAMYKGRKVAIKPSIKSTTLQKIKLEARDRAASATKGRSNAKGGSEMKSRRREFEDFARALDMD